MSFSYDKFAKAFLEKISEYDFMQLDEESRTPIVDGYMKRALAAFRTSDKYDTYDFATTASDEERCFDIDVAVGDEDELIDIVSEGMVVQWLKPYVYKQELLENVLNTNDFTAYSPAELLLRVGNAYEKAQKDYKQMLINYSYDHGDLTDLHL